MARLIRYIFISFFAILLMSHNSYAVDGSLNITSIRYANYHPGNVAYCTEQAAQNEIVYGNCGNKYWVSDSSGGLTYTANVHTSFSGVQFETPDDANFQLQYNDIISMDYDIYQASANNSLDTSVISVRSITSGFQVIDQQYQQLDNTTGKIKLLLWCSRVEGYQSGSYVIRMVAAKAPPNDLYSWNLGWLRETNAYINPGVVNVFHFQSPSSGGSSFDDTDIVNSLDEVKDAIENSQNAESEAANDATEEAQTQSDNSQSSVDSATTNLIGALGSIGSALTNAPATDCIIDITTRNFSIGQVNLCSNVPQEVLNFVSGLLAIVLTPIVLYYIFHIITYMYNLFQEFQR